MPEIDYGKIERMAKSRLDAKNEGFHYGLAAVIKMLRESRDLAKAVKVADPWTPEGLLDAAADYLEAHGPENPYR